MSDIMQDTLNRIRYAEPGERYSLALAQWKLNAFGVACDMDAVNAQRGLPVNAGNSYAGALLTEFLAAAVATKLTNRFAPFAAFTRKFSTDAYKPLAPCEVKFVVSGAAAQLNPSNHESGGDSVMT